MGCTGEGGARKVRGGGKSFNDLQGASCEANRFAAECIEDDSLLTGSSSEVCLVTGVK